MANKKIDMQKIQTVLRLHQRNYSMRAISRQTGIHRSVVKHYLESFHKSGVNLDEALQLPLSALTTLIYSAEQTTPTNKRQRDFETFSHYALVELQKKHVTLQLLHKEYSTQHADAYGYSQFCDLLGRFNKDIDISMVQKYSPGELMQVDFTGDKLHWVDVPTGEQCAAEVLVITLGYSGLTFVRALTSQKQEEFISCLNKALVFFGGVPVQLRVDNLKAGVIKADRYEPGFNKLLSLFCEHYGLIPDATRARKPRDKAQVESHVRIVYERIFAPLRNQSFTSIDQINEAIIPLLEEHNKRPYRGSKKGRIEFFTQEERPVLKPLTEKLFTPKHYKKVVVQKNYHLWIGEDQHYYSVPFAYVGKEVELVYDLDSVEIYHQLERIAFHLRSHRTGGYTTLSSHMPEQHLKVKEGMDPDQLIARAARSGPSTKIFIEKVLSRGAHCQPNFKTCQGILSLAKKFSDQRLERATQRALQYHNITYRAVQSILSQNLDSLANNPEKHPPLPFNNTARGAISYQ
jgi:transposase